MKAKNKTSYDRGFNEGFNKGFNEGYAAAGGWPLHTEKKMKIINLTPHGLNIHTPDGTIDVPPSGAVARVEVASTAGEAVTGIPVTVATYGAVEGLPAPADNVIYVVSGIVEAKVNRPDVYSPGPLVRNADGKPVGCKGLKQSAPTALDEIKAVVDGFEADYCDYEAAAALAFGKITEIIG